MTSGQLIYINGKYCQKEAAKISVYDHGLLYGDGVFEGIRCYNGNVFRLKQHIDRLYQGASTIKLGIPVSTEDMSKIVCDTIRKNGLKDAYVRLVVTRGAGELDIDPDKCRNPSVVCIAQNFGSLYGDMYEKGIRVVTAANRVLHGSLGAKAKTLNYLNNIMGKAQANAAGCDEALMLNDLGRVCEGAGANFFIVKDGELYTPPAEAGILLGVTREAVLELATKFKITAHEKDMAISDAYAADEAFMTGTAAEIVPVVELDARRIGDGKPGPITKRLIAEFKKIREKDGTKI